MRPRIRPRPALAIGLFGAIALLATAALFPAVSPTQETLASRPAAPTLDATLSRDVDGCAGVQSTLWHPLSGVEYTGRLAVTLPPLLGGAIVLFIGDSVPLDIEAVFPDGSPVLMQRERFASAVGVQIPPDYWLDDGDPWRAPEQITRVVIDAYGDRELAFTILLGRRAPRVLARLIGYAPGVRVPVCATPMREGEKYYATGWYGEEVAQGGSVRWMAGHGAVLLPSADGGPVLVRINAAPAVAPQADRQTLLTLRVNDVYEAAAETMRDGFADYEWRIPSHAWVAGTNELFFTVSRTEVRGTRALGMALALLDAQ